MNVPVRLNAIRSYQSQQASPAIRDITISGDTRYITVSSPMRHHCLWPYKTSRSPTVQGLSVCDCTRHLRLRLRPVYAIGRLAICKCDEVYLVDCPSWNTPQFQGSRLMASIMGVFLFTDFYFQILTVLVLLGMRSIVIFWFKVTVRLRILWK
jgi:hypothetical protein